MRLLLGFLLLLTLFAGALAWQKRFGATESVSAAGPAAVGVTPLASDATAPRAHAPEPPPAARPYPSDWGRVIVGRPSGAQPVAVPKLEREPSDARAANSPAGPAPSSVHAPAPPVANGNGAPAPARAFELTVQAGQSLSSICQAHYHSARPALVNALARYNQLADPSRLRAGQKLRLPPENELLAP